MWIEFDRPPWRLRAIHCEDVEIEGDVSFAGESNVYMWFVADQEHCEWFAHGLSNAVNDSLADTIAENIVDTEFTALLPYAGVSWENVESLAVAIGCQQRALWAALQGYTMEELCKMTRDNIKKLRAIEASALWAKWN